jgi:hypothetical protein
MSLPRVPGDLVSFFSGHTYAQRPVSFIWNDQEYQVEMVLSEWKTPDGKIFQVRTTGGEEFELVYEGDN